MCALLVGPPASRLRVVSVLCVVLLTSPIATTGQAAPVAVDPEPHLQVGEDLGADEPRVGDYGEWFRIGLSSGRVDRFVLPMGFRLLAVAGDRLYGYLLTEFDAPVVTVFRLRETSGG